MSTDKKALQRERTRRYFIDAAKELVKTQGLEQVSVRNVADLAGYSYATIYNYFSDLNALLWYVTVDLIEEMAARLGAIPLTGDDPVQWLKQGYHDYVRYYLESPAVFRFLFHSQIGAPPPEVTPLLELNQIGLQQVRVLQEFVVRQLLTAEDVPLVAQTLVAVVHGLLLMHFASSPRISESEMFAALDLEIDFVLQRLVPPNAVK